MVLYTFALIIISIIALVNAPYYTVSREKFEESLAKLNKSSSVRMVCGILSIILAFIPIIDACLDKMVDYNMQYEHYKRMVSPIFRCDYSDSTSSICLFLAIMAICVWLFWIFSNLGYKDRNRKKLENEIKAKEERLAEVAAKKKAEDDENSKQLSLLTATLGNPEKIIKTLDNSIEKAFIVFSSTSNIYYNSRAIPFSQLVSCDIKDDSYTTTTGTKQAITKSKNGSTLGRAVVGGILAGPAGAIIGGATSKKTTEIIDNTQTITHHHYYAIITTASTSNPIIKIDCGKKSKLAQEIKAVVSGIIATQPKANSGSPMIADELVKLAALKEQGILSQDEFDQQKQKLLSIQASTPFVSLNNQHQVTEISFPEEENEDDAELIQLLNDGLYFNAIQKYKDHSGCSLEEAKEYIDHLSADN